MNKPEMVTFVMSAYREFSYAEQALNLGARHFFRKPIDITMKRIIKHCKKILQDHYGSQFQDLILYGSVARSQSDSESDIDMLVILNRPFDYFRELRNITDLLYPLQLESKQLMSVKPAPVDEFESGDIQLYRNAKSEGLAV